MEKRLWNVGEKKSEDQVFAIKKKKKGKNKKVITSIPGRKLEAEN